MPCGISFPAPQKSRTTLAHAAAGDGHNIAKPQAQLAGAISQLFNVTAGSHPGARVALQVPGNRGLGTPLSLCFPPHPSMLQLPMQTACPLLPAASSPIPNCSTRLPQERKTATPQTTPLWSLLVLMVIKEINRVHFSFEIQVQKGYNIMFSVHFLQNITYIPF